jgi:hypothetical protein
VGLVDSGATVNVQINFFVEFDVCFFRSKLEFEVNPKAP